MSALYPSEQLNSELGFSDGDDGPQARFSDGESQEEAEGKGDGINDAAADGRGSVLCFCVNISIHD